MIIFGIAQGFFEIIDCCYRVSTERFIVVFTGVVDKINQTIQEKEVNEIKNKIEKLQKEIRYIV